LTQSAGRSYPASPHTIWPWVTVAFAAILPYVVNLNDYFVRDDFGVVQLLAQKPFTYFPRWFVTSWMDHIWGYYPDEIRPFPAVSYQITALGGAVSPFLHHLLNVLIHAANGLLVMAVARRAAGLPVKSAMFAGLVFVLLPVHAESVAWITGRVDSMPALFYLASFLAYVIYRERHRRYAYVVSLLLFFLALFTKQNTITMVATLVGYDLIVRRRPIFPPIAFLTPYVPFAVMTLGYLWLRYLLFGQVAREGTLNARGLSDFAILHGRHLRHVVVGDMSAPAIVVTLVLLIVVAVWLLVRRLETARSARCDDIGRRLVFFGPVWWALGVLPVAVAGYHSPRHVYLAAVGWAIVLGVILDAAFRVRVDRAWQRAIGALAVLAIVFYVVPLAGAVRDWRTMAFVSHQVVRDVRSVALSAPERSLVIIGAPGRSWEWAMPFAVRQPFQRTNLDERVFFIFPRALSCCTSPWFEETRRAIRSWSAAGGRDSVIALKWNQETGALARASGAENPQLAVLIRSLLDMEKPDELDTNLRRIIDVLVVENR
jgi:hypothetical protein